MYLMTAFEQLSLGELLSALANTGLLIKDTEKQIIQERAQLVGTDFSITLVESGAIYTVILLGDLSSDGLITAADARMALRASAELDELTPTQTAADTDNNREMTASNARKILRASASLELPLEWLEKYKVNI